MLAAITAAGCGGPSREAVLAELTPEDGFAVHLFYRDRLPPSETDELNRFHNSNPVITEGLTGIQFWNRSEKRIADWTDALDIREFPVYVVLDAEGVVLKTPYLSEVKFVLSETLLP